MNPSFATVADVPQVLNHYWNSYHPRDGLVFLLYVICILSKLLNNVSICSIRSSANVT